MEFLTLLLIVFLMSSVTVLAILLVKKLLGNRVSPHFHYLIWMILIVRLLFPILPQSQISMPPPLAPLSVLIWILSNGRRCSYHH